MIRLLKLVIVLGLVCLPWLALAQNLPGASISAGSSYATLIKSRCANTTVTIVNAATVIPFTTCYEEITSGPGSATTLTGTTPIAAGSGEGQTLKIVNLTGFAVSISTSATNVNPPPGGAALITIGANGGTQNFVYSAAAGGWAVDSGNTIDATQVVTGLLPVARGGTGLGTLTNHSVQVGAGTSTPTQLAVGATGQVLQGNTGADPSWGSPTVSSGSLAAIWSPSATASLADATNFAYPLKLTTFIGKVRRLTCSWLTVGTISGGTDVINLKVRDTTAPSDLCNCTFTGAACNVTAGTIETCDCNSGAMTAGDVYTLQFSASTNCVANPAAVTCSVELVDP